MVIEEVIILTTMKDIGEMKEDLRRGHLEEPVSSVEVKDIEHLNFIMEVSVRDLNIPKEQVLWMKNLLYLLIWLGNRKTVSH